MIQLQCIKVCYDAQDKKVLYLMQDVNGMCHQILTKELIRGIQYGDYACTNVQLTPDGKLVTPPGVGKLDYNQPVVETSPAVKAYRSYMQRLKFMGIEPDAEYIVSGSDVILKHVFVKRGTFVIREFVTHIACNVWFVGSKAIGVNSVFVDAQDIKVVNNSNVTDMSWLFAGCAAGRIDLRNFDTSMVTIMHGMFYESASREILGLENFNTSNVITMSGMFQICRNLTSLHIANFNTSRVRDFSNMFYACDKLTSVDVSNFDTSSALSLSSMFFYCQKLGTVDVSHFNTTRVKDFSAMFANCVCLESVDISHFDFRSVEYIDNMFATCSNIKYLDLSRLNEAILKSASGFATFCTNLEVLDISFMTRKFSLNVRDVLGTDPVVECKNLKIVYINSCFNTEKLSRQVQWLISKCRHASNNVQILCK